MTAGPMTTTLLDATLVVHAIVNRGQTRKRHGKQKTNVWGAVSIIQT